MKSQLPPKVAIIDYQMGNMFSVRHACAHVGLSPVITSDPGEIMGADAAILPGVGAFGDAMGNIRRLDLDEPIKDFIASGRLFMGICLGLQILFSESEEFGSFQGLGIIPGTVRRLPQLTSEGVPIKVPQIGWNAITPPAGEFGGQYGMLSSKFSGTPLEDIRIGESMYFVHSFCVHPADPGVILTMTGYEGFPFCSSILRRNLFASQFHPEKSAREGIKIYERWASMIKNL